MEKPIINGNDIVMSLEWFGEAVNAVNRTSLACGGLLNQEEASTLSAKLLLMNVEEVKNYNL